MTDGSNSNSVPKVAVNRIKTADSDGTIFDPVPHSCPNWKEIWPNRIQIPANCGTEIILAPRLATIRC
jgi:hypothetical protein